MKDSHFRKLIPLIILMIFAGCNPDGNDKIITGRGIVTSSGMVVSAHPEASLIGVGVLKKGGNAIDAAVATQFALAVCYPAAGNIGGGGLAVIRMADGTADALDFREKAPGKASRDMYLDENGDPVEGLSTDTGMASGVPGSVAGAIEMHRKYGSIGFEEVIQPAIDLARKGFPLTEDQARSLNAMRKVFLERNDNPVAFTLNNEWHEGDILIQPELASTLELIRDKGTGGFYKGEVAEMIVRQMESSGGLVSLSDLENYSAVWRTPVIAPFDKYTIISMPPPSSGGIALIQLLGMISDYPVSDWGFHSDSAVHLMVEAERRVYADRSEYLGDPDFVDIPVNKLIDRDYLKYRMRDFDPGHSTDSKDIGAGDINYESEETTHFSVVDGDGNAVSVTTTLNGGYGNSIVVGGAGFLMNNEMDDFSVKPGVPNIYGLVGGDANAIEPGKRMLSSMTPTIVERNDSLFMVVGSPGGSTIITSVFQTILNVTDFSMDMQQAVDAGRFHHQWLPDYISYEKGALDSLLIRSLISRGHTLRQRSSIGRVDAIRVLADGRLEAGADSRGDDTAAGY